MPPRSWQSLIGDESGLIAELVAPGVTRLSERVVSEAERSFFYLAEGGEKDCLIDGGWGFGRALDALRGDQPKRLVAIATHSHFDHVGMLHLAADVFTHASEAKILQDPDPVATQALPYLDGRAVLADGGAIDPATIRQEPSGTISMIDEGDTLDLGGRLLEILHVPGHSPGSLAVLDRREGLLFCADTVHDGHIWDDIPGADRTALLLSHERLKQVEFQQACPGHGALLSQDAFRDRIARYRRDAGM